MKSSAKKVELASVDDLFTTEQERQESGEEKVVRIPLTQLHYFKGYPAMHTEVPFTGQPYRVKDDDPKMLETLDTRGLASICKEGVDAIGSALKELETAGYIVRRQLRGTNGRITDTEYVIYEQPQPDMSQPDTASPDTENPDMVKPDIKCTQSQGHNEIPKT